MAKLCTTFIFSIYASLEFFNDRIFFLLYYKYLIFNGKYMGGKILKMFGFIFFVCGFFASGRAEAKVFVVNDAGDTTVCNSICTLRGAIEESNTNAEVDIITIDQKVKYIAIGSMLSIVSNDSLDSSVDVTITGNAIIDAQKKSRVFAVSKATHAVMDSISVTGGYLYSSSSLQGAGIYNQGILELYSVKVFGNVIKHTSLKKKSKIQGAGIYNAYGAELTITKSQIGPRNMLELEGVDASAQGAGAYNAGELSILDSNIFNNTAFAQSKADKGFAKAEGGGLFNTASTPVYIYGTAIYLNKATATIKDKPVHAQSAGAGIYTDSSSKMYVTNSTISGNESVSFGYTSPESFAFAHGGALYSSTYAKVYLANVTVAGNLVSVPTSKYPTGAAVGHSFFAVIAPGYVFKVRNSIITSKGENCIYKIESEGNNVISDNSCFIATKVGDKINTDPLLLLLSSNGGFTKTHALMPGSPAVDAGNVDGCFDYDGKLLEVDQRGNYRSKNRCDAGAFEL